VRGGFPVRGGDDRPVRDRHPGRDRRRRRPGFAGLGIGIALAVIHIVGIQVTGVSVNPARSLGPAIFVGGQALAQLWLFFVAPAIGAVLGALLYRFNLLKVG
jgi:aquaporin Z